MKLKKYKTLDKFKNSPVLAEIEKLNLSFQTKNGKKLIINNTSLKIRKGEILGIIGESGSGKSVITSTLTGMNSDIQIVNSGNIKINNLDVTNFTPEQWQESNLRGKFVSQVFQNPLSSLNPYRKIGKQIIETILINSPKGSITTSQARDKAIELLEMVMINNAVEVMEMYPHQMSGGMNQRIVIVIILSAKPNLIIFDEPTTALDPAAQAQIIEIIRMIRDTTQIGIILITHDIALVSSIADTITIMYAGQIVEQGLVKEVIQRPLHPYTWGLMRSIPEISTKGDLYTIPGQVPSDISKINGDPFAPRNIGYALEIDFNVKPPEFMASNTHYVWSWLYDKDAPDFNPPKLISSLWKKYKGIK